MRRIYENEYDSHDNLIKVVEQRTVGEDIFKIYYLYEYDEEGNDIKCKLYYDDGTTIDYYNKEYDELGNCIKEVRNGFTHTYEYDMFGNVILDSNNAQNGL